VFPGVAGPTAAGVLASMCRSLGELGAVPEAAALAAELTTREARCTTALGGGIAVPHGRLPGLPEPLVALGFVSPPADFAAPDGLRVDLVYRLHSPADSPARHLSLLARLSRILKLVGIAERLRAAGTPAAAARVLREAEAELMVSQR
jgi:PTS system nitrogen regulatory IIA component